MCCGPRGFRRRRHEILTTPFPGCRHGGDLARGRPRRRYPAQAHPGREDSPVSRQRHQGHGRALPRRRRSPPRHRTDQDAGRPPGHPSARQDHANHIAALHAFPLVLLGPGDGFGVQPRAGRRVARHGAAYSSRALHEPGAISFGRPQFRKPGRGSLPRRRDIGGLHPGRPAGRGGRLRVHPGGERLRSAAPLHQLQHGRAARCARCTCFRSKCRSPTAARGS